MSTITTVPAVIDAVLAAIPPGISAHESWPGPIASGEMVTLGEVTWDSYEIPTIKAARKQRQEVWAVEFGLYVAGVPGSSPSDPRAARQRAFELLGELEDMFADDPSIGIGYAHVQHVQLRPATAGPVVFEQGWAYRIAGSIAVSARLN